MKIKRSYISKTVAGCFLHHMGANLADNIIQGQAGPDEFRTTPLWGVGQRIFFLHDGRTSDLLEAILAHFSPPSAPDPRHHDPAYPASEANGVIRNFKELSIHDKQSVLDFLRSLYPPRSRKNHGFSCKGSDRPMRPPQL